MVHTPVPKLNLQDFVAGPPEAQARFIEAAGKALEHIGFFVLTNTGLTPSLLGSAYRSAAAFFALPAAVKQRYELGHLKGQGGFTRFGREHAKGAPVPDLKEFWHVNRPPGEKADNSRDKQSAVLWPQEVPEFGSVMTQLYHQLETCAEVLLEACALYLGQPRAWLRDMTSGGNTVLRIAHYPPLPENAPPGSLRAAPHEDINFITLLCRATAPGLEILTQSGDWLPLQADPDDIIVDTGDMLQNLTNGLFRSTTHRVVNPANVHESRLSLPFFVHPRSEVDLSPHPACIAKTGGSAHYPALSAKEYLAQRLREIGLG